jgi:hypothetical protein
MVRKTCKNRSLSRLVIFFPDLSQAPVGGSLGVWKVDIRPPSDWPSRPGRKLSWLATERYEADDFAMPKSLRREALRLAEERLDPTDKALAPLLANLALSLHFEARGAEADPLVRRALAIAEESGELNTLGALRRT